MSNIDITISVEGSEITCEVILNDAGALTYAIRAENAMGATLEAKEDVLLAKETIDQTAQDIATAQGEINQKATEVETAKEAAETAATNAGTSENNAAGSASTASSAATTATNAATSAQAARDSIYPVQRTGLNIQYDRHAIYNTPDSPGTGNITQTLDASDRIGIVQKIYHEDSSEPDYPTGWVPVGFGVYEDGELNLIFVEKASATRFEYWTAQEQ